VTATKISQTQIDVDASTVPQWATAFDVEDDGTGVASDESLPWSHMSPNPGVTHKYRVRGTIGALKGAWSSYSNTIQLQAPPSAPTNLSPNGVFADKAANLRLAWQHNPVDSSVQSHSQIRWRPSGGTWTTGSDITSADQFLDIADPLAFFGAVGVFEWQARTKGADPSWSAWSATASFELITAPGAAVTQPSVTWNASTVVAKWSFTQAEGKTQSAWEARLRSGTTVLETRSGSGATSQVTFTRKAQDNESLNVQVRVQAGGVWSAWAEEPFTVTFLLPAEPVLSGLWNEQTGSVDLELDAGVDPLLADTEFLMLERSIGETWEPVGVFEPDHLLLSDFESLSNGVTTYRLTAYTDEGATADTVVPVTADSDAVWLGGGIGYAMTARLPFSPKVALSFGRQRFNRQYAGRTKPVVYTVDATSKIVKVSGKILDWDQWNAALDQLEQIAYTTTDLHVHRDPDGRRVYGMLSMIDTPREMGVLSGGVWSYSYSVEEGETA